MSRVALILLLMSMSCTKEFSVPDYQQFDDRLTVNGSISPQFGAYIEVSPLLDPRQEFVVAKSFLTEARVDLCDSVGTLIEQLKYDNEQGYISSQQVAIANNKTYIVKVSHIGYPEAHAVVNIPMKINELGMRLLQLDESNHTAKIELSYLEPQNVLMYYRLWVFGDRRTKSTRVNEYPDQDDGDVYKYFCNLNSPNFYDNSCLANVRNQVKVELWVDRIRTDTEGLSEESKAYFISEDLELEIQSISSIFKQYSAFLAQLPTDIDLFFTDQHETPSNVENGFGLVAGKSIHSVKVDL